MDLTDNELLETLNRCLTGAQRASEELRRRRERERKGRIETEPESAIPQSGIAGS